MLMEAVKDRLVGKKILQQRQHEGAKDRTEERADAAEDHHHQQASGLLPAEEGGVDVAVLRSLEISREPRERTREHEDRELVAEDGIAQRAHARLVGADAQDDMAE